MDGDLFQRLIQLVPINGLEQRAQKEILNHAEILRFPRGTTLFQEGDRDHHSYYLLEGEVYLLIGKEVVGKVENYMEIAHYPLAQQHPRRLTVAAASDTILVLRIDRALLDRILLLQDSPGSADHQEEKPLAGGEPEQEQWMSRMLQSELFSRIPAANIQRIFSKLEAVNLNPGEVVISQGAVGDYYYIIKSGSCEVLRRTAKNKDPVRLAVLNPGDTFGEEALVTQACRNATVRMLTTGMLLRLTKDDFVELIKKPLLRGLSLEEAKQKAEKSQAVWIDVRFPDEFSTEHMPDAVNIPLNLLRQNIDRLAKDRPYITYCDTGSRSVAGAFLLSERGYNAYHLNGGLMRLPASQGFHVGENVKPDILPLPAKGEEKRAPKAPLQIPIPPPASDVSTPSKEKSPLEADVQFHALNAQIAEISLQIEQVKDLKEAVREIPFDQPTQVEVAERDRLNAVADETLNGAEALRDTLENERNLAEQAAAEARERENARILRMQKEADERLKQEQTRLEKAYAWQAEELERVIQEKQEAQSEIDLEITPDEDEKEKSAAQVKRMSEILKAKKAAMPISDNEAEKNRLMLDARLQEKMRERLQDERRRLESEFARNAKQLTEAKQEQAAANMGRLAAEAESRKIIDERRRDFDLKIQELREQLTEDRQRLQSEEAEIERDLEETRKSKDLAWEAQRSVEAKIDRQRMLMAMGGGKSHMATELATLEDELKKVKSEVFSALQAHRAAQARKDLFDAEIRKHKEKEEQIVKGDTLEQSVNEEEDASRIALLARQKSFITRIQQSAEKATKQATGQTNDQSLIDDLAEILSHPGVDK